MIAEGGGVAPHAGEQLQFAPGLANRGGECRPHAVVTGIEDQYGSLGLARRLALRDQGG